MNPITSQKARKRANRDLEMVQQQIARLDQEREISIAGFEKAKLFLQREATAIREAMNAYDREASAQQEIV